MRPNLLLIEDHASVAAALERLVAPYVAVTVASTCSEARALCTSRAWAAIIVDERLPDGHGLDVVADVEGVPMALWTAYAEAHVINRATAMGMAVVIKPDDLGVLIDWVQAIAGEDSLDDLVAAFGHAYDLSAAERSLLKLSALGSDESAIAAHRGTAVQTVRNQVKRLIEKTGDDGLRAATIRMFRDARRYFV